MGHHNTTVMIRPSLCLLLCCGLCACALPCFSDCLRGNRKSAKDWEADRDQWFETLVECAPECGWLVAIPLQKREGPYHDQQLTDTRKRGSWSKRETTAHMDSDLVQYLARRHLAKKVRSSVEDYFPLSTISRETGSDQQPISIQNRGSWSKRQQTGVREDCDCDRRNGILLEDGNGWINGENSINVNIRSSDTTLQTDSVDKKGSWSKRQPITVHKRAGFSKQRPIIVTVRGSWSKRQQPITTFVKESWSKRHPIKMPVTGSWSKRQQPITMPVRGSWSKRLPIRIAKTDGRVERTRMAVWKNMANLDKYEAYTERRSKRGSWSK